MSSSASATISAAFSPATPAPKFRFHPALTRGPSSASSAPGTAMASRLSHPLAAATLRQIHDYPWPDPNWQDVSHVRGDALAWNRQYAILGGDWSSFWHDAIDLLGMETLYLKMYDEPELVDALLKHLVDYYAAVSQRIFDAAADALDIFFIGNDFGSQTGPLLSPAQFDRFMLPHLKRLIDLGHAYRLRVQLHCCGGFEPLISAMIAAGLDGLHAVQPCCRGMDLATLKSRYGKAILLNGGDRFPPRPHQGHARFRPPGNPRSPRHHGSRRRLRRRRQPRLHPGGNARRERRGDV